MNPPTKKLSFGLNKAALPRQAPPVSNAKGKGKGKVTAFQSFDSDDDEDNGKVKNASGSVNRPPSIAKGVSSSKLSKQQRLKQAQELELDKSAYEYDEVYDAMKQGEKLALESIKQESSDRKPKYISKLMETAELRKQDRLRAEDKMIAKEREREGDEFKDKEQFVTPSYLKQQEELRKLELEEQKLEEANAGKKGGMTSFYKNYLDSSSATHAAAVAATTQQQQETSSASFKVGPPPPIVPQEREKTDVELAKEHEVKTGKKIEVNDDGEIIDKRQLMQGGLNLVSKPKRLGPQLPNSTSGGGGFSLTIQERQKLAAEEKEREDSANRGEGGGLGGLLHPGVSAEERRKQMRERQSREIERQMVELEKKRKREQEEELERKVVQKKERRNDETKVEMLKRMAEERRKKREQEAVEAAKMSANATSQ